MDCKVINLNKVFHTLNDKQKFDLYRKFWKDTGDYNLQTSFPLHLDIELAGICNLKCDSCFQNGLIDGPLGIMDTKLFKEIIAEGVAKGLCAIKLQVRGESFLHPDIFECIKFAKKKGVMDIQITTNGTLLDEVKIAQILDSGLDSIIFSADAHHANNFNNKTRYSSIEKHIISLLEQRKKQNKKRPWVRIQSSIPKMDSELFAKAKNYIREKFPLADIHVINRIHDFRDDHDAYDDLHTSYDLLPCSYPMQRLAIFWNGEVTTCCSDYNNKFQLGNCTSASIEDIWQSSALKTFRSLHAAGKREGMAICRHCPADIKLKENNGLSIDKTDRHVEEFAME